MNLLFDFLKNLPESEKNKLRNLQISGVSRGVWQLVNEQAIKGVFDRTRIQKELAISSGHLDKTTSLLLEKCYSHLFPNNVLGLLGFLSSRVAFVKHFYHELKRQLKYAEAEFDKKELIAFYNANINFIYFNMPIMHKDEKVLKKLAAKYLAFERGSNAKLSIECKLMYVQVDKLFAAATVQSLRDRLKKKIDALGKLPKDADEELTFTYYWLKIYFNNAIENFPASVVVSEEAARALKKFKSVQSQINMLRIELKLSELLYYLNRFEDSFQKFERWMKSPLADKIPDRGYYTTKYLQVSLITNHLKEAEMILEEKKTLPPAQLREVLLPRDIISFAKFYLFNGDYQEAFDFIQLGFEKNPKGKYFQYEVELRNLQTAYFFLVNDRSMLVQLCNKHMKYLHAHGYPISKSDFPFFYVLTKAMLKKGRNLSEKEIKMLDRYQLGSYGVYGKLLLKMLDKA